MSRCQAALFDVGSLYTARRRGNWAAAILDCYPARPAETPHRSCPKETRDLMSEFILTDYESLKQKTRYASWIALKLACERRGYTRAEPQDVLPRGAFATRI